MNGYGCESGGNGIGGEGVEKWSGDVCGGGVGGGGDDVGGGGLHLVVVVGDPFRVGVGLLFGPGVVEVVEVVEFVEIVELVVGIVVGYVVVEVVVVVLAFSHKNSRLVQKKEETASLKMKKNKIKKEKGEWREELKEEEMEKGTEEK